jgi:hypothetical protein
LADQGWAADELRLQMEFGLEINELIGVLTTAGGPLCGIGRVLGEESWSSLALLVLAAAADLSTEVARGYGHLRDRSGPALPDVALLLDLVAPQPTERAQLRIHIGESGPLLALSLIELAPGPHLLAKEVRAHESIVRALAGRLPTPSSVIRVEDLVAEVPAIDHTRAAVAAALADRADAVVVVGATGSGRRSLVTAVAEEHGRAVVSVDLVAGPVAVQAAVRDAHLAGALVHVDLGRGHDSIEIARLMEFAPRPLLGSRLVHGQSPGWLGHVVEIEMGMPTAAMRRQLWERWLGSPPPPLEPDPLALMPAEIHQVVAGLPPTPQPAIVQRAIAAVLRRRPPILAERLGRPAQLDDLSASAEARAGIAALVAQARTRSGGAVFAGPIGSGRTDAARAVAAALGRTLHRIDMLRHKSRFSEETESHLRRAFLDAEAEGAVLLLAHAETVAARGAAEIGVLLREVDAFSGLAILAASSLGQIDRRLAPIAEIEFGPAPVALGNGLVEEAGIFS